MKVSQEALRASQSLKTIHRGGGLDRGSESQLRGDLESAEGARSQARGFDRWTGGSEGQQMGFEGHPGVSGLDKGA